MRKGFTLVELLAVIVILAVIALITIPAVMKMIDTSTINSYRRSIDLYGKAVSQGIISYESDMVEKNKPINITFENIDSYIEYEGNDVDCKDKTIYSDRTILLTECTVQDELVYAEEGRGYGDENYYYYTNSRKKMKLIKYIEAVEEAIKDKNISGTCTIGEDKITCNDQEISIKSKLENAIEGTLTIENNKVKSYSNLRFETEKKTETNNEVPQVIDEQNTNDNNSQTQEKYATLVSDSDGDGEISIGDKYTYKVNNTDTFNFYVLSFNEDNTVNLIMDRNICADGTTNYTEENNYCNCAWHDILDNISDNTKGPDTAMKQLYDGTKEWQNVPNMNLIYNDIEDNLKAGYRWTTDYGYTGINITNGLGKIISKSGEEKILELVDNKPIKARLSKFSEIYGNSDKKCSYEYASCPTWLVENIDLNRSFSYCSACMEKYENTSNISGIYGYWMISSFPEFDDYAQLVYYYGNSYGNLLTGQYANYVRNDSYGVRPVITVPISYLTN